MAVGRETIHSFYRSVARTWTWTWTWTWVYYYYDIITGMRAIIIVWIPQAQYYQVVTLHFTGYEYCCSYCMVLKHTIGPYTPVAICRCGLVLNFAIENHSRYVQYKCMIQLKGGLLIIHSYDYRTGSTGSNDLLYDRCGTYVHRTRARLHNIGFNLQAPHYFQRKVEFKKLPSFHGRGLFWLARELWNFI